MKTNTPKPNQQGRAEHAQASRGIFPKLRFKEFTDEWQEKKLGEIAELTSSKRVYLSDYVSNGVPFYRGKEISELKKNVKPKGVLYISDQTYSEFKERFGVPKINDILITAVGTLGNVMRIRNNDQFYFKDGNLIWLKNVEGSPSFIETLLENSKKKLIESAIGSSQQALTIVGLNKIKLRIPSQDEQEKIAGFLGAVDEKINHLEAKKKGFEKYKKGVMQAIFPAKGGQVPKIRFKKPDGSDYPDWEEKKVSDIFQITRGNVLSTGLLKKDTDENYRYPVYSSQTTNNGLLGYYNRYLFEDCITWTTDGANAGDVNFRVGRFYCTNVCGVLKSTIGYSNLCISEILNRNTRNYVSYVGNPKLMNNVMGMIKISIPKSIEEQQTIAEFLMYLDKKVELISKELGQAKLFKKSLLQQMFV